MTKTEIKTYLLNTYCAHAAAHLYLLGYTNRGLVWRVVVTADQLDFITTLDKASRGAGYSLRFKPTKAQKSYLESLGAEVVCSERYFKELKAMSGYNNGEVFEKNETERVGQTWYKDNVPFTEDGDLTIDGVAYQLKFERATFINEAQAHRLNRA